MTDIDWSKAPEGATHKHPFAWYKRVEDKWFFVPNGAEDWKPSIHQWTDDEFTAVRPTEQPQWNGEGLPPVGTVCNIKIDGGTQGVIVAHVMDKHRQGAIIQCENEWWYGEAKSFTPIKTERDQQIDAIEAIIYRSECETTSAAERLYNAGFRIGGGE